MGPQSSCGTSQKAGAKLLSRTFCSCLTGMAPDSATALTLPSFTKLPRTDST